MPEEPNNYEFTDDTKIEIEEGRITSAEKKWLEKNGVLREMGHNMNTGEVTKASFDFKELARIAFEFDLLDAVASSVETDILAEFRNAENEILTTKQLADLTGRPKSSVSRGLSRLVQKNKITKVQAGVYQYP